MIDEIPLVAPQAPWLLRRVIVALLLNPGVAPDVFLVIADALAEAAAEAGFRGEAARPHATSLEALAALLRRHVGEPRTQDRACPTHRWT